MGHTTTRSRVSYVFSDGREVKIPRHADVAPPFQPDGKYARHVAHALRRMPLFTGDACTETVEGLAVFMPRRIIRVSASTKIRWGILVAHYDDSRVDRPEVSPFVRGVDLPRSRTLTLHVVRNGRALKLVRAYAGDVEPPLPWMRAAHTYGDGGWQGCVNFWRGHAFVDTGHTINPHSISDVPPKWAR